MKIIRVLTYTGTEEWISNTLKHAGVQEGIMGRYECQNGTVVETLRLTEADERRLMDNIDCEHVRHDGVRMCVWCIQALQLALKEARSRNLSSVCIYCKTVTVGETPEESRAKVVKHITEDCAQHPLRRIVGVCEAAQNVLDYIDDNDCTSGDGIRALGRLRDELKKLETFHQVGGKK